MTPIIKSEALYLEKPWNLIPNNQMLKDEIEKRILIIKKESNLKYKINFFFYWRVKLKRKFNLTKWQKNQKNKDQNRNKK